MIEVTNTATGIFVIKESDVLSMLETSEGKGIKYKNLICWR